MNKEITFIDLFAGTGGFSIALEKHGKFKCIFANDFAKSSEETYKLNHKNCNFLLEDINKLDVGYENDAFS